MLDNFQDKEIQTMDLPMQEHTRNFDNYVFGK